MHSAESASGDSTAPASREKHHQNTDIAKVPYVGAETSVVSRHVGSRATQAQLGLGRSGKAPEGGTEFGGGVRLHQGKSKRKGIHAGGTTCGSEEGP